MDTAQTHREPNWDMSPFFSRPDGDDYTTFRDQLAADLTALVADTAALAPGGGEGAADETWRAALRRLEDATARLSHLSIYLDCVAAADARDDVIKRERAGLARLRATIETCYAQVQAGLGGLSDARFDALVGAEPLASARYFLTRLRKRAAWSMTAPLERLAADLSIDGLSAWSRLYDQISGNLTFELAVPGREPETRPVATVRSLLEDADPAVRRAALRGSAAAWKQMSEPLAACLNAIAGTRLTLYARRGVPHFLDPALFDSAIERRTLDVMLEVVRARQDVARRYLRRKAALLGGDRIGFHDLRAPLPGAGADAGAIPWSGAVRRVSAAFGKTYPALHELAERAIADRWIDWEPRDGKRPGGFCATSDVIPHSRVFMTYNGTAGDVRTLAHELGHAFHGWLTRDLRPWARTEPMTLAETASTFAEQLVTDAALAEARASDADGAQAKTARILDDRLRDAEAFLLNIPMRFDFEYALYTERQSGELSVARLCELMLEAQRRNYGDVLDLEQGDPWFWASKLHFYIDEISFYNFPYTFGYLFSKGIAARARAEGGSFLPTYEDLLRRTGSETAEDVARNTLGVDLQRPEFWNASIDLLQADLDEFEQITAH